MLSLVKPISSIPPNVRRGLARLGIVSYVVWALAAIYHVATGPYGDLAEKCYPRAPQGNSELGYIGIADTGFISLFGSGSAREYAIELWSAGCDINRTKSSYVNDDPKAAYMFDGYDYHKAGIKPSVWMTWIALVFLAPLAITGLGVVIILAMIWVRNGFKAEQSEVGIG